MRLCFSLGDIDGVYQVSFLFINPHNSSLLIGTRQLGMFKHIETIDHTGNECMTSHDGVCNQALYNPLFNVVSQQKFINTIS